MFLLLTHQTLFFIIPAFLLVGIMEYLEQSVFSLVQALRVGGRACRRLRVLVWVRLPHLLFPRPFYHEFVAYRSECQPKDEQGFR
jgi:hypothetical protein